MSNLRGKVRQASRQSGLSRWLLANHSWFGRELQEAGVPNWDAITLLLNKEGLTDKYGNPYNKDAVRIGVNQFFKKFPALLPVTTQGRPVPQPPEIEHPTAPIPDPLPNPSPSASVSRETPDFIAMSQAIKRNRTIK